MLNKEVNNVIDLVPFLTGDAQQTEQIELIAKEISEYLSTLNLAIKPVAASFRERNLKEASQGFLSIIEGLDWTAQFINIIKSRSEAEFAKLVCNNVTAVELEAELLNILTELVSAHVKENWGYIADLLDHELSRNISSWQVVLPKI